MKCPKCEKPMKQLAFLGGGERWGCKPCKFRVEVEPNVEASKESLPPPKESLRDWLYNRDV